MDGSLFSSDESNGDRMIGEGSGCLNAIHSQLDHIRRPQEMLCSGILNRTSKKKNAASCRCL
jgi:hypothetical protein